MSHLPITYYRIGQLIEISSTKTRSAIIELGEDHITCQFGRTTDGLDIVHPISPIMAKPVLRPLTQLRMSHVIGLYRMHFPDSTKQDGDVLEHVAELQSRQKDILELWADSTEPCLWLASLGYDVQGLIKKGLAVTDEL